MLFFFSKKSSLFLFCFELDYNLQITKAVKTGLSLEQLIFASFCTFKS